MGIDGIKVWMRYVVHLLRLMRSRIFASWDFHKIYSEAIFGVAHRWHGEINPLFSYHLLLHVLKKEGFNGEVLELGGGYSTVVLSQLTTGSKVSITSVDVNPGKYLRILPSLGARNFLFSKVSREDKLTVNLDELYFAYHNMLESEVAKYGCEEFQQAINSFIKFPIADEDLPYCAVREVLVRGNFDASDLKEALLGSAEFQEELRFYKGRSVNDASIVQSYIKSASRVDAIFFDCGEFSSLPEWLYLKDQIRVGGFAAFHDIYFPKSVKNFLVCALVTLDPEWEIVDVDTYTEQGLLIAKRVS